MRDFDGQNDAAEWLAPSWTGRCIKVLAHRLYLNIRSHSVLLGNSGAIAMGTFASAVLGFVFWWVAARFFTLETVGVAAALIAAMGLVGYIGEGGIGTLLMGKLITNPARKDGLIMAAACTATVSCLLLGLAFLAFSALFLGKSEINPQGILIPTLLAVGCAATGLSFILDTTFAGQLKSSYHFYRNASFSGLKLLLLVILQARGNGGSELWWILGSWIAGLVTSEVAIVGLALRNGLLRFCAPDFRSLFSFMPAVIDHHILNLVAQAPYLSIPLLVSIVISPTANAAFYAAWMMMTIVLMVPAALTSVLYTVGTSDPGMLIHKIRFSLIASTAVAISGGSIFALFPHAILDAFNPHYGDIAASSLQLLGLGAVGTTVRYHYITVVRVREQMRPAAMLLGVTGLAELAAASYGGWIYGLKGLTIGWVVAVLLEGAFLLRFILRGGASRPRRAVASMIIARCDIEARS